MMRVQIINDGSWVAGFADGVWRGMTDEMDCQTTIRFLKRCSELEGEKVLAEGEQRGVIWEQYLRDSIPDDGLGVEWDNIIDEGEGVEYSDFLRLFQDVSPFYTTEFVFAQA